VKKKEGGVKGSKGTGASRDSVTFRTTSGRGPMEYRGQSKFTGGDVKSLAKGKRLGKQKKKKLPKAERRGKPLKKKNT